MRPFKSVIGSLPKGMQRLKSAFGLTGSTRGLTQVVEIQQIDHESITEKPSIPEEQQENSGNWLTMAEEEHEESSGLDGSHGTELRDLTESSIAFILSLTTPRDVARLACVNRTFRSASESDVVWQRMLPSSSADVLAQAVDAPASTCSKKEVYHFLCNRILLPSGICDYWLDRATGAACQSIGSRALSIGQVEDDRFWQWRTKRGSRFSEVAYLRMTFRLYVAGRWEGNLSPGTYTLSWRLRLGEHHLSYFGHNHEFSGKTIGPVTFSFEATGNDQVNTVCYLIGQSTGKERVDTVCSLNGWIPESGPRTSISGGPPLGYRPNSEAWVELDVGEFSVENEDSPFEINFHLEQTDSENSKFDLYIDCVAIRPSFTIQNRIPLKYLNRQV